MIRYLLKNPDEIISYDYAVCEIKNCDKEGIILAMTETRIVDFCKKHHKIYILGEHETN